jgi:hypothetical protein
MPSMPLKRSEISLTASSGLVQSMPETLDEDAVTQAESWPSNGIGHLLIAWSAS